MFIPVDIALVKIEWSPDNANVQSEIIDQKHQEESFFDYKFEWSTSSTNFAFPVPIGMTLSLMFFIF